MNKFPRIEHITDLLPFIEGNKQFRVQEQPNGTTVVCYMLQDEDTFRGEHEEYAKECRGITFDKDGKIASRTLHKFQNVGENENTQPDMIPWDRIVRVMDKRDGSMITFVLVDGRPMAKTKKTFTSNEALAAQAFLDADVDKLTWVQQMLENNITPTFEWTSPRFPIVLTYKEDALTLLQLRYNMSGDYVMDFTDPVFTDCPFPIVENLMGTHLTRPQGLLEQALITEGIEGWIIQADDGEMWKIKTSWYVKLHHSVTFTRWRDIARTVLADESDDLKAAFAMTGRSIEPILEVERKIGRELRIIEDAVDLHVMNGRALNRTPKDMALAFKDHHLFGFVMSTFRGKTVDYRAWYLKDKIRDWSLEVIIQNEDIEVPAADEEEQA